MVQHEKCRLQDSMRMNIMKSHPMIFPWGRLCFSLLSMFLNGNFFFCEFTTTSADFPKEHAFNEKFLCVVFSMPECGSQTAPHHTITVKKISFMRAFFFLAEDESAIRITKWMAKMKNENQKRFGRANNMLRMKRRALRETKRFWYCCHVRN